MVKGQKGDFSKISFIVILDVVYLNVIIYNYSKVYLKELFSQNCLLIVLFVLLLTKDYKILCVYSC